MFRKVMLPLSIAGFFSLSACAGNLFGTKPKEPLAVPITQDHERSMGQPAGEGLVSRVNLYKDNSYRDFFKDLRAHKVGDLVTVNIVETSKAKKKATTKTSRQSSIDAGVNNLMGWETKLDSLGISSAFDNDPMFKAKMKNSFDGSGETSRDESMTASITARVMEVLPNGNLFVRGSRQIKVNHESQYIVLSGLVRPADVSPDNTVLSSFIGDAKIEYTGSGPVSDKQRPGWLMRLVDFVWPF